jgi:hypothetical protein
MANPLEILGFTEDILAFVVEKLNEGLSGSAILRGLQEIGEGIRRQNFFQGLSYLAKEAVEPRKYISALTLNAYPTITRLPQSLSKQLRNFSYRTVVSGFDVMTGELKTLNISVSSNTLLTKQQALDIAGAMAEQQGGRYGLESAAGTVTDIFQNSGGLVTP